MLALCRMIDGGQVFARIDEAAGMVRFLEDPERYDTAKVVQRIDAQIQQSIAISGRLTDINQRVCAQPLFGIRYCAFCHSRSPDDSNVALLYKAILVLYVLNEAESSQLSKNVMTEGF